MPSLFPRLARAVSIVVAATALCGTATTIGSLAPSASATTYLTLSPFDARLLADINNARSARGIRRLVVVAGTTDVAHGWSCRLASLGYLAHNPYLGSQLDTHGSYYWTTYGENVGMLPTTSGADALFRAYMNSAPHRANILDPDYKYIGVHTKNTALYRWNVLDFVGRTSSSYSYSYGVARKTC